MVLQKSETPFLTAFPTPPTPPTTHEHLIDAAQEAWDSLDLDIMRRLSETISHRVQAIIEAEGWYTSY